LPEYWGVRWVFRSRSCTRPASVYVNCCTKFSVKGIAVSVWPPGRRSATTRAEFDPDGREKRPNRNLGGTPTRRLCPSFKANGFSAILARGNSLLSTSRVGIPGIGQLTGGDSDSSANQRIQGIFSLILRLGIDERP
jgi:hypothetical protein